MNDTDTTSPEVSLDTWAIIELFGHARIAGKVTNVSIAGCGFIRVQVPEHDGRKAYTRDIAPKLCMPSIRATRPPRGQHWATAVNRR